MGPIFRSCGILVLLASVFFGCRCLAQGEDALSNDPLCKPLEARLSLLDTRLSREEPLAKRMDLLHFLDTVGEDELNCVTRATQSRLVDIEQNLIHLKFQNALIAPDWLYQCNRIDLRTQKCLGGSPYEDEIPRDTNEEMRASHAVPPREQTASVSIAPGMACHVKTVSVSEFQWFFVKGHPPRILAKGGGMFRLEPLRHMRTPILIASIRCEDNLHFRKAAWQLRLKK